MKKLLALSLFLAAWLGIGQTANAKFETFELSMEARPSAGPLFKEVARPIEARLEVSATNPDTETQMTPTKVSTVNFPRDMSFNPDPKKTPVCPQSKIGPSATLADGILEVIKLCPRSVVGTGAARVQLARNKGPSPIPTLTDPQMVIFNAGRNRAGNPKITIYGFSKTVNVGTVMTGSLARNGALRMDLAVMPFDSAVSSFSFDLPGEGMEVEDRSSPTGFTTVKGMDPDYLRAKCSTGSWKASGEFLLGERDEATGLPVSEEYFLTSNVFTLPCEGRAGRAKLKINGISGPKRIRAGRKGTFTLRVSNSGTATARNVRVTARGGANGSVRVGKLVPGASKKVRVKVRASKRGRKARVAFRLNAKSVRAVKRNRMFTIR